MTNSIGHNKPPVVDVDALRDGINQRNGELLARAQELIDASERMPTITGDDPAQKVTDYVSQCNACIKALEGVRVGEKEPFLTGGKTVDGFFAKWKSGLQGVSSNAQRALGEYMREKEARERRRREEEERLAREEAERIAREAVEAAAKIETETDLVDAVDAERRSDQAEADLVRAEKAASAPAADLARTRGDMGGLATLRTVWTFNDLDRDHIDLEALRPYIPQSAIEQALRAYIKAGGREIRGAHIFKDKVAMVR